MTPGRLLRIENGPADMLFLLFPLSSGRNHQEGQENGHCILGTLSVGKITVSGSTYRSTRGLFLVPKRKKKRAGKNAVFRKEHHT